MNDNAELAGAKLAEYALVLLEDSKLRPLLQTELQPFREADGGDTVADPIAEVADQFIFTLLHFFKHNENSTTL
jgi:hypothetical protein